VAPLVSVAKTELFIRSVFVLHNFIIKGIKNEDEAFMRMGNRTKD
jgi:hypothetical protein